MPEPFSPSVSYPICSAPLRPNKEVIKALVHDEMFYNIGYSLWVKKFAPPYVFGDGNCPFSFVIMHTYNYLDFYQQCKSIYLPLFLNTLSRANKMTGFSACCDNSRAFLDLVKWQFEEKGSPLNTTIIAHISKAPCNYQSIKA